MSFRETDFAAEVKLCVAIHHAYPNIAAELTAIVGALGSDLTTHDCTIEATAAALQIHHEKQTRFTNDILVLVNQAKGGGLNNSQIISGIDDATGVPHAPATIDTPWVSGATVRGSVLSCTMGNWTGSPTSYAYQWKSGGVNVGTNAATYTTVVGDVGKAVGCVVTATNAQGSTAAPLSNTIVVT